MKKLNGKAESGKFDLLLSKISDEDVLSVNEMICIRGGDGDEPPIKPPNN